MKKKATNLRSRGHGRGWRERAWDGLERGKKKGNGALIKLIC